MALVYGNALHVKYNPSITAYSAPTIGSRSPYPPCVVVRSAPASWYGPTLAYPGNVRRTLPHMVPRLGIRNIPSVVREDGYQAWSHGGDDTPYTAWLIKPSRNTRYAQ